MVIDKSALLTRHPALRRQLTLASKCGMTGVDLAGDGKLVRVIDGRPATLRATIDESLSRLRCDVIDLYYLHRWDKQVPIEDSVGALSDMVRAGKIRGIGLSEVSADTLARANKVHPIAAVQTEYSLWTRNPEIAVLKACADIGATFVAFSPVGRGFLVQNPPVFDALDAKDIRRSMPRFTPEHFASNLKLHGALSQLAQSLGHTPAQIALAWLLHQAPHIMTIPGTVNAAHLRENMAANAISLDANTLSQLNELFKPSAVSGSRYNALGNSEVDTETF